MAGRGCADAGSPAIEVIPGRNVLRLVARPPLTAATALHAIEATLDVGGRGRLLGVELAIAGAPELAGPWRGGTGPGVAAYDAATATLYLGLQADADGLRHARSVQAPVRALADGGGGLVAVEIPRRGPGYEIAYPSGNR